MKTSSSSSGRFAVFRGTSDAVFLLPAKREWYKVLFLWIATARRSLSGCRNVQRKSCSPYLSIGGEEQREETLEDVGDNARLISSRLQKRLL